MKEKEKKVMIFGTFDGLHEGHLDFFKQAKKLSGKTELIVSIARDKNVAKLKGQIPLFNEKKRMSLVKKCDLVDKVVLSGLGDHIPHIIKEAPDIIALGYDQKFYIKNLKKYLKDKGISIKIVRLKPYKEKIYKSHLLNKKKIIIIISVINKSKKTCKR